MVMVSGRMACVEQNVRGHGVISVRMGEVGDMVTGGGDLRAPQRCQIIMVWRLAGAGGNNCRNKKLLLSAGQ